MDQLYVRLRNSTFAEAGYCLEPIELKKDSTAYFCTIGAQGKPIKLDRVPGCEGDSEATISIPLLQYANVGVAHKALAMMVTYLGDAVAGKAHARTVMAAAWCSMLLDGLMLEAQDSKTQIGILNCLYGSGRVMDALNRHGSVAFLGAPNWGAMLDEARPALLRFAL